ncbi:MAG: hypothetical protein AAF533_12265 [Acidobacteriota bacterium]
MTHRVALTLCCLFAASFGFLSLGCDDTHPTIEPSPSDCALLPEEHVPEHALTWDEAVLRARADAVDWCPGGLTYHLGHDPSCGLLVVRKSGGFSIDYLVYDATDGSFVTYLQLVDYGHPECPYLAHWPIHLECLDFVLDFVLDEDLCD